MSIITNPAGKLISAEQTGSGNGVPIDTRAAMPLAYLFFFSNTSAVWTIQASHDLTAWMPVMTVTASASASAQMSGNFYPYIRAQINNLYSAAGGTGSGTLFYHPLV